MPVFLYCAPDSRILSHILTMVNNWMSAATSPLKGNHRADTE